MLTLNSNILKIGNKWILPVQSGGVVPPEPGEIVSYVLRVWNSHDRRINFQKLVLTDQDPTTVDYSVLPSGNRPTQNPVAYVPPLITSVKAYTLGSNTSYDMSSQIQEYANGGVMDTGNTGTIRTAWENKRYEGYVDMEFTWPYSFPIISSSSIKVWNGFEFQLYGILSTGHYVELAHALCNGGGVNFNIDTSTVYDVTTSGQGTVSLWPSAGNEGDQLAIHWEPPSGYSLSSFIVNGTGASESDGILIVGTEDVTLTPNYDIYGDYDRYELEITPSPTGAVYIGNMSNPTPVSGTYTTMYGTNTLSSSELSAIVNGPGGNLYGGEVIKYTLAFGATSVPYIHWKSIVGANGAYPTNVYNPNRIATAQLYGWKFGIKYPLGTTKFRQSQVENEYKVSTCRNMNIPMYNVTTTATTGGSLTASPSLGMSGAQVTLTPTADSGYVFDSYTLVSGTGASISGNTLTIGTSHVTVRANFAAIPSGYDHYEVRFTSTNTNQDSMSIWAINTRPDSGYWYDNWNRRTNLTSGNFDDMQSSSNGYNSSFTNQQYLSLTFSDITGGVLTWYDSLNPYVTPTGTSITATLYGVDGGGNMTQLDQIGPYTYTYNVQRSLSTT